MLTDDVRAMIDGRNFGTLTTVRPDGAPQSSVVWIGRDGDDVLVSSVADKQKVRNVEAERRVSLSVFDQADPYSSVEVRGTARIVPDPAKELPKSLSHKYLGIDPPEDKVGDHRVVIRISPERVLVFTP